ncbi:hypothetical protein EG68_08197 [Paragonimus skrjabini miyazakii]|uniref:Uncharacterized protein n=1 Tax=Paragonimus skrjabini miyazakii TaxID=59628 RepID=A0A8S9YQP6_9TREM|nr:hypothetical protein EG68_08197 [Paragonimus skrjabini miyazakii]
MLVYLCPHDSTPPLNWATVVGMVTGSRGLETCRQIARRRVWCYSCKVGRWRPGWERRLCRRRLPIT